VPDRRKLEREPGSATGGAEAGINEKTTWNNGVRLGLRAGFNASTACR